MKKVFKMGLALAGLATLSIGAGLVPEGGNKVAVAGPTTTTTTPPTTLAQGNCSFPNQTVPGGPDPWLGCWPGPDTTGVPFNTTLTHFEGDMFVDSAVVIENMDIHGCVTVVTAEFVRIQNTRITCPDPAKQALSRSNAGTWMLVDHSEVLCEQPISGSVGIYGAGMNIEYTKVAGCSTNMKIQGAVTMLESWLSSPTLTNSVSLYIESGYQIDAHHNSIIGGTGGLNALSGSDTCYCGGHNSTGAQGVQVYENLFDGGYIAVDCPGTVTGFYGIWQNRWARNFASPIDSCSKIKPWSSNLYADNNQPVGQIV